MSEYFPKPKSLEGRVKVSTGVDTSKFGKKVDLANLKSNEDKLDIDKLKNVPTNLGNLI